MSSESLAAACRDEAAVAGGVFMAVDLGTKPVVAGVMLATIKVTRAAAAREEEYCGVFGIGCIECTSILLFFLFQTRRLRLTRRLLNCSFKLRSRKKRAVRSFFPRRREKLCCCRNIDEIQSVIDVLAAERSAFMVKESARVGWRETSAW